MRGSPVRVRLSAHFPRESEFKRSDSFLFSYKKRRCGLSSVGRALASQAEGRGFESRNPLNGIVRMRILTLPEKKNTEKEKKVAEKFAGFKK